MDSFYPKFGEVEMVLVDDDNDFYDPLETNLEFEDKEDVSFQLNDTAYEECKFHLNIDDNYKKDTIVDSRTIGEGVKVENAYKTYSSESTSDLAIKIESQDENSNDTFVAEYMNEDFHTNDSEDSLDEFPNETKSNSVDISQENIYTVQSHNEKKINNTKPVAENQIENSLTDEVKTKREQSKSITKTETGSAVTTQSKDSAENECKPKEKRLNVEKEIESSSQKTTRHYSKRNEIPKRAEHNEAYDKKLLNCKICNIQFERSPFFTEHMRTKHSIDKPFECFICSKTYRISSLLAEHIRYHFGEKPYKCKFCDRSFSQLQPYKAHIRKLHTLERPYRCNFVDENDVQCKESFFDTKTYKFHVRAHTNQQPFTCNFCSKKFNHSGTYQAHMRIHTNERPYQCVICGKSFAQISTHKAHMLTHSDEFKFPCTQPGCNKKFKQATNLKLHMRVHTKETPYKCEDCGRGFAQLVTYRNHRRIHTGEKPFKCTYTDCGKSFRHRNSFRRHLQTHTGEKPFECKICFKRLSQTSSYLSHMRRHEKLDKR